MLTAEDWIEAVAYYSLQPWGEMRRDQRQEALIATLAAPLMGEGYQMPSLRYPYECDGGIEIDSEATLEALASYQERIYGPQDKQGIFRLSRPIQVSGLGDTPIV